MTKLSMTTSGHFHRKGFVSRHSKIIIGLNMSFDAALMALAFCLAYIVRTGFLFANDYSFSHTPNYYLVLLIFVMCYFLGFNVSELYITFCDQKFKQIFLKIVMGAFVGTMTGIFCNLLRFSTDNTVTTFGDGKKTMPYFFSVPLLTIATAVKLIIWPVFYSFGVRADKEANRKYVFLSEFY